MNTHSLIYARAASAIAVCSVLWSTAQAQVQVNDAAALLKWVQQAQQMEQSVAQLKAQLAALTDVPQNLQQQVAGLLNSAVQNPLGNITQNLNVLMAGSGTGTCGGAQAVLTQNQYLAATGGDFIGQQMNQTANRNAGLMACTQQMLTATQSRLAQMPQLLTELQGSADVTQVATVSARIQQETATINAQQQQAMLVAQSALLQNQMSEQQLYQKQRADAQEVIRATSAGAPAGNVPAVTVPPYAAN
jgi:type IV secretion system protein VirB5